MEHTVWKKLIALFAIFAGIAGGILLVIRYADTLTNAFRNAVAWISEKAQKIFFDLPIHT